MKNIVFLAPFLEKGLSKAADSVYTFKTSLELDKGDFYAITFTFNSCY